MDQDAANAKTWGCDAKCIDDCVARGFGYYMERAESQCGWTCPSPFQWEGGDAAHMFYSTPSKAII